MRWASSLGCYLLVIIGLVTVFAPGLLPPYRGWRAARRRRRAIRNLGRPPHRRRRGR